ncbi:MAG: PAS domain S-box protein, partial [Desulfobulbaceae bacterium]|nr:PAS domain S-box protein [Desulfobulbaceae bacterium]
MKGKKLPTQSEQPATPEPGINTSSLMESPFDFVIILDRHGQILSASETTSIRFQLSNEELVGKCIWDILPSEVVSHRKTFVNDVFQNGTAVRFKDERQGLWHDNILIPIFNRQGETEKVAVLAYDISSLIQAEEKIKLLSRFPEENPNPVFRVSDTGVVLYANKAGAFLLASCNCKVGEQLPEGLRQKLPEIVSTGSVREIDYTCGDKIFSLTLSPNLIDATVNIYALEITQRNQEKKALAESEARYRDLVETSHNMIWKCDDNGNFTYLNPAWERTLGYSMAEMLGHHFNEFKPHEITTLEDFQNVKNGKDLLGHETIYISKTGEHKTLVFNARKLTDADGKILGAQGTVYDITERKQAEEKLQQNESRYRNLFMNSPGAILETDLTKVGEWLHELRAAGVDDLEMYLLEHPNAFQQSVNLIHITDINLSARKMFELKANDKLSDIIPNIFRQDSFSLLRSFLLALWEEMKQFEKEGRGYTSKGKPFDFILQWNTPEKDGKLLLSQGILTITDITETKILEKRLIQNEKMVTLGLLVSGISHEINNPNNFIMFNLPILRGYLEKLLPIIDDYSAGQPNFELFGMSYPEFRKDVSTLLDNMEHGTNRINDTVSRLREFFSPQDRKLLCWVDINSVIEKSVALCQSQVQKMIKSLKLDIPKNLQKFYTDPHALEHIIINLLINAGYAADKNNSWIKIKVSQGKNLQEG